MTEMVLVVWSGKATLRIELDPVIVLTTGASWGDFSADMDKNYHVYFFL